MMPNDEGLAGSLAIASEGGDIINHAAAAKIRQPIV